MVTSKGKPSMRANRGAEDRITRKIAGTKDFKVYSENLASSTGPSVKGVPKPASRKVLLDVSNLQPPFPRREVRGGSKPVVPIGPGNRNVNAAAKKVSMGKVKVNPSESVGNYWSLKKVSQSVKISSDDKRANCSNHSSVSSGRIAANGRLMQTRKSLPVFKRVDKADSSAGNAAPRKVSMACKTKPVKVKVNLREGVGSNFNSKQVAVIQAVKVSSGDQRAKGQGHASTSIGRKSLPVLKRVDKEDSSIKCERISENYKGNNKVSVKYKDGEKMEPQISQARSHQWRNHASDAFVAMEPKGQTNVGSHMLPKKSVRPIVKTSIGARNARRSSKSRSSSCSTKLLNATTKSSKGQVEVATSTLPEAATSIDANKTTQGDLACDENNNLCMKASDVIIVSRKSCRRRSFTSSLVAGLKILEKDAEKTQQKVLPSIDDISNQLEVAEYVDEIYQYYWVTEAQNPCLTDYMNLQSNITPQMRGILINWLIEVNYKFDLMPETLYLTVALLDRYLSLVAIKKNEMQLVGLTALLIASKYEDFWHPRIKDLISISAESYTRDQLLGMEKLILNKLKFRLNLPTLYVFMLRFLKAAQGDTKLEHLAFFLIELCLVEYEALKYKPSMLCASAIYVARCTLQLSPAWTPLLSQHARYDESQISDCAAMILSFHKAAKTGMLNVTFDKYMRSELGGVAAIKPLDKM